MKQAHPPQPAEPDNAIASKHAHASLTSRGWFFAFKLYLILKEKGELGSAENDSSADTCDAEVRIYN